VKSEKEKVLRPPNPPTAEKVGKGKSENKRAIS
jgi:hypothetical protein